jgi:tetratricopeptide (TPR) repeat protein
MHEFNKAISAYNAAIEINPNMAVAYFNRASAYYALGDYINSQRDFAKARDLDIENNK